MDDRPDPSPLAAYPVRITLPVQWGEMDAFQHVNNAVYFRWLESSRIAYTHRLGFGDLYRDQQIGPILATTTCDYRHQIQYPDTVEVGTRVVGIGRTSIRLEHAIYSQAAHRQAAQASSTIVMFDYAAQQPTPVTESLRLAIAHLEGRTI